MSSVWLRKPNQLFWMQNTSNHSTYLCAQGREGTALPLPGEEGQPVVFVSPLLPSLGHGCTKDHTEEGLLIQLLSSPTRSVYRTTEAGQRSPFLLWVLLAVGSAIFYFFNINQEIKDKSFLESETKAFHTAQRDMLSLYQPPPTGWGPWGSEHTAKWEIKRCPVSYRCTPLAGNELAQAPKWASALLCVLFPPQTLRCLQILG